MTIIDTSNIRIKVAPNREYNVSLSELNDLIDCGEKLRRNEPEVPINRVGHTSLEGI